MKKRLLLALDVDKYLADGGQLLDMRMYSKEQFPMLEAAITTLDDPEINERVARYGRFMMLVAAAVTDDEKVGDRLTEYDMRNLWAQSRKTSPLAV